MGELGTGGHGNIKDPVRVRIEWESTERKGWKREAFGCQLETRYKRNSQKSTIIILAKTPRNGGYIAYIGHHL